jgi:hypothetical protein
VLPTLGPKEFTVVPPVFSKRSVGNPTGDCGLEVISFQFQFAALTRTSFRSVDEKVWFQTAETALLI